MDVIRNCRVWRIRRKLRGGMVQLRSARVALEETKAMTDDFNNRYSEGSEQERREIIHTLCEGINHVSEAIDFLRPYSPPGSMMEVMDEIQQMSKLERILMARNSRG